MNAIAEQSAAAGVLSRTLFVGLAMIETMAIYCVVVALLLLLCLRRASLIEFLRARLIFPLQAPRPR